MDINATVEIPGELTVTIKSTMTVLEWRALRDSIASIAGSGVEIGQFYATINQVVENAISQVKA